MHKLIKSAGEEGVLKVRSVTSVIKKYIVPAVSGCLLVVGPVHAQDAGSTEFTSYVDVMFNYEQSETDDEFTVTNSSSLAIRDGTPNGTVVDPLDAAMGATVLVGFRRAGWYGFEFGLGLSKDGDSDAEKQSFQFNTLIYPFDDSNLYFKLATGITRYDKYQFQRDRFPIEKNNSDFFTLDVGGGLGYVLPVEIGDIKLGIRAEAVYIIGDRFTERDTDFHEDYDVPGKLEELHFNLGIRFQL